MSGKLTSIMGSLAATPVDIEAVKVRGWRESGILVVSRDDQRLTEAERAEIRRLGKKLYGGDV
jgi:hypothetical protein